MTNPIEWFIHAYGTHPKVLEALRNLETPLDSQGNPRELNRTTLAELAGVSYPVVHRTELGVFNRIPPKLIGFMKAHSHPYINWESVYREYRGLIEAKNILAAKKEAKANDKHWTKEDPHSVASVPVITFKDWRRRHFDSMMNLAKTVLVNPTIIANYENGQTQQLPDMLRVQFKKFGMNDLLIRHIAGLARPVEGTKLRDNELVVEL